MLVTIACALVAGFFAGNGIPYFITGSFSQDHPFLLGRSAAANIVAGVSAFAVAAVLWHFARVGVHPVIGYASGFAGMLIVGLIHARVWRTNPRLRRNKERRLDPES